MDSILKKCSTHQNMETTTLSTGLTDCWLMLTHLARASEGTLTLMRTRTGPKIHQVMFSISHHIVV